VITVPLASLRKPPVKRARAMTPMTFWASFFPCSNAMKHEEQICRTPKTFLPPRGVAPRAIQTEITSRT
jgi:hypothetical protein